jgi:penicillin-binding protein 2
MLIIDQLKKGDRSLRLLALIIFTGMAVLATGLFHVQIISGHRFRASQINQSFRTVRTPAVRGNIFDTTGIPLAENRPVYNVNLYLEELRPHFQASYRHQTRNITLSRAQRTELGRHIRYTVVSNLVQLTSTALHHPLTLDSRQFHRHYQERLALPLTIAHDLNIETVSRFVEGAANLPGLDLEVQPLRHYPQGPLAAHTLGYLKRDDRPITEDLFTRYSLPDYAGAVGIEGAFDPYLRGQAGIKSVLVNNLGYRQSELTWDPADPGHDIHLTLHAPLQAATENALRTAGPDARGAIVVMHVHSGDILALASAPTFNPNQFVPRMLATDWAPLQDPVLTPLFNRATAGLYAPGSIFKIIVALAGLEAGLIDPDRIYHSPGYYLLGSGPNARKIRDTANGGQPAQFDFIRAFKQSSNAYFIHHGLLTGLENIVALGQRLHLGERTGLPVGQESAGVFPTAEWRNQARRGTWFDGDTANLTIGQGYITVTPLQMAVLTAAIANDGTVLWPRIVSHIQPQNPHRAHDIIHFPPANVRNHLGVSIRSLRLVQKGMLADVEDDDGTGHRARIPGYPIAAKTGTAQVRKPGGRMDHITWFAAFGPNPNPQYAVVVMIESGTSGGVTCAPVAREVFRHLRQLDSLPGTLLATSHPTSP